VTDLAQELADLSVTLARSQTATLAEYPELPDVLREASDEIERLRAEVADLRARLAAEAGGEVDGWECIIWRGEFRWRCVTAASGWDVIVERDRAYLSHLSWRWYWVAIRPGDLESRSGVAVMALDAMTAAVAAYERLRGEEDGDDD